MSDELQEEFDVLESIYPTELSSENITLSGPAISYLPRGISDREINIDVEPDDLIDGALPCASTNYSGLDLKT